MRAGESANWDYGVVISFEHTTLGGVGITQVLAASKRDRSGNVKATGPSRNPSIEEAWKLDQRRGRNSHMLVIAFGPGASSVVQAMYVCDWVGGGA